MILWAVKAACATCVPSSSKQTLADSHCSTALQSIRSMDRRVAAVAVSILVCSGWCARLCPFV